MSGMRMLQAFVDIHDNDVQRTFNGIQNFLEECGSALNAEEWQMAMYLAECLYPCAQVINTSTNLEQIEAAIGELTEHKHDDFKLLNVIYAKNILDYRGLWDAYCEYRQSCN